MHKNPTTFVVRSRETRDPHKTLYVVCTLRMEEPKQRKGLRESLMVMDSHSHTFRMYPYSLSSFPKKMRLRMVLLKTFITLLSGI